MRNREYHLRGRGEQLRSENLPLRSRTEQLRGREEHLRRREGHLQGREEQLRRHEEQLGVEKSFRTRLGVLAQGTVSALPSSHPAGLEMGLISPGSCQSRGR